MPQDRFQLTTPEMSILLDPTGAGFQQREALLRRWAWWRGRTDVILDLDVLGALAAAEEAPAAGTFVTLAHLLPDEWLDAAGRLELRRLFDACAASPPPALVGALQAVRVAVESRVTDHFVAMRVDAAEGGLVPEVPPTPA